ncbi:hypothetical protein Lfu02_41940 [Longispora fulva]|uniref:Putative copper export protein/methionine-rich copper-binding protein CopC n=1 Tax=Longispora fulva TaxID=619741 RepID=A0A8J7GA77_9ACTN|nr:CopD family protein [Longispora fulva]MBG6136653.1 putative copper export protein/methionine-rich copper-binding protein CopC [Longispora fulva]GIG59822.1 hypothetical protein Lfu02_41940 [Longispora fulva]
MRALVRQAWRLAPVTVAMVVAFLGAGFGGTAVADPGTGPVSTQPAANAVVPGVAGQVVVRFAEPADPEGGTATVYTAEHVPVVSGALTASATDPGALVLAVPKLGKGVHTVVWSLADRRTGSFAFQVEPSGASPVAVTHAAPVFAASPLEKVFTTWVPMVAVMVFVGALLVRFVVTSSAGRRIADPEIAAVVRGAVDRRLLRLAAVSIVVFVPATVTQAAFSAGKGTIAYGKVWTMITADGGQMWFVRLAATALAFLLVVPMAVRRRPPVWVLAAGLALGLVELLARVLPTSKPADLTLTAIGDTFTFGHLLGAAVWIGGMVALVVLAAPNVVPAGSRRPFWFAAIRRFSTVAMISVVVLTMSGLWLYWKHVGDLSQLLTTVYGQALTVKLILFGGLLLLGAVHQFWLLPRMAAARELGRDDRLLTLVTSRFRAIILAEVVLGLAVLFVVPFLSGSARNQVYQENAANLTRTAAAGSAAVSLTPSGLQPGLTDYDVTVAHSTANRVTVSFSSDTLKVPRTDVLAVALGDGHYRVSGLYTPMVGDWRVAVAVNGQDEPAVFTERVAAKPAKATKAPPVTPTWSTWGFGAAELLLVLLTLLAATRVSRHLGTRNAKRAARPELATAAES